MKNDQMPEGFLATREGDVVRVLLPEVVVTAAHVLEPMLTRGAAQQVAEALWNADVESPLARVVLVRDARYSEANVEKFRERLWAVLVEGGVETQIEIEVATPTDAATPEPAASAESPAPGTSAEPSAGPPPAPGTGPAKKSFVAPVPARRRVGGDRGSRDAGKA